MRHVRNVHICGAGAVGASYAERFEALDPSMTKVVASGERRARLEKEGLTVNGRSFAVRCVGSGEGPPADLLLVAVKHHQLATAVEDVRGSVGDGTILLSLLNGIASEAVLAEAFGAEKVLHGFVLGNDVVREGSHVRYSSLGKLVFGAVSNDRSDPRVLATKEVFDRAGIVNVVPDDILREQWWKFMLNVGVNQVTAVLRAPYRAFREVPQVRELTRLAALEAVAVARAEGVRLSEEDVEGIFPIVTGLAPDGKTSMLQDIDAGRKTEVEIFAGTVIELGARHGLPTPVNELLAIMIAALERLASPAP
jgi:2-dehydropantoate 2-reductase